LVGCNHFISPSRICDGNHSVSLTSEVVAGVQNVAVEAGSDFLTVFENLVTVANLENPIGEALNFITMVSSVSMMI